MMKRKFLIAAVSLFCALSMLASCEGDSTKQEPNSSDESALPQESSSEEAPPEENYSSITLAGKSITEYSILMDNSNNAMVLMYVTKMNDKIAEITGKTLPTVKEATGTDIIIKCGPGIDARQGKVSFSNGSLIIEGGTQSAFIDIIKEFTATLKPDASYEKNYILFNFDKDSKMDAYFNGTTTKDALSYAVGEEIEFNISLISDGRVIGAQKFQYTIEGDDGQKKTETVSGKDGTLTVKTKLNSPGFVHLTVKALENDGTVISNYKVYEGGAGAGIQNIQQTHAEPSDFDAFWSEQIARIDALGVQVISKTEMPSNNDAYYVYDVHIKCVDGSQPATGVLTVPKNAAAGTLKAKMLFTGYSDGKVQAMGAVFEKDTIVLNVNSHGAANYGKDAAYYTEMTNEITKTDGNKTYKFGFYTEDNKDPETCYFLNMHLRNTQLARYLVSLPEYNGEGVTLEAGSMGAMQATFVAWQLREDAGLLKISYPWLSDLHDATDGKLKSIFFPALRDGGELVEGLFYYDTLNFAKRVSSSCKVQMYCRLGDYTCPPSGQVLVYNAFTTSDKELTFRQNGTHGTVTGDNITYTVSWK